MGWLSCFCANAACRDAGGGWESDTRSARAATGPYILRALVTPGARGKVTGNQRARLASL